MNPLCYWSRRSLAQHAAVGEPISPTSPLARHVERCAACRREWEALTRLHQRLSAGPAAPEAPASLARDVLARIGTERPSLPQRRLAPAFAAIAVAVLGCAYAGWKSSIRNRGAPQNVVIARGARTPPPAPLPRKRLPSPPRPGARDTGPLPGAGREPRALPLRESGPSVAASNPQPGVPPRGEPAAPARPPVSDDHYLDGRDPELMVQWSRGRSRDQDLLNAFVRRLPPMKDDFAQVPLPRLASGAGKSSVAAAVKNYEQEAKVIDTRLFRKVTLQLKAASLEELCRALQEQTGVQLQAARLVRDENATLFVKEKPARDVMRAVARLFGYVWARSGAEGGYQYSLTQDLRSRLAEEELRNRELNEATLALVEEMDAYRPYLGLSSEELNSRSEKADRAEQSRLFPIVVEGGWGAMQLYHRLSGEDRTALLSGQDLVFTPDASQPERRIPPGWIRPTLQSTSSHVGRPGGGSGPISEVPGATVASIRLWLDRGELGQASLQSSTIVTWSEGGGKSTVFLSGTLARGKPPATVTPDNARLNAALRERPAFRRVVSIQPEPSCDGPREDQFKQAIRPHVSSADVWEAVHHATGRNIVADAYSRLHAVPPLIVKDAPLFDALCRVGDTLGARWKEDGDFTLCRSTSYVWDKLKEVPKQQLARWRDESRRHGGVSLDTLLEIASLSDNQLDSATVGEAVMHCWGVQEWRMVGAGPRHRGTIRTRVRYFAALSPRSREQALQPQGVAFRDLTPNEQWGFLQLWRGVGEERAFGSSAEASNLTPEVLANARYYAEYSPAGWYEWRPPPGKAVSQYPKRAPTPAEALANARRIYPEASPDQIHRSMGWFDGNPTLIYPAR